MFSKHTFRIGERTERIKQTPKVNSFYSTIWSTLLRQCYTKVHVHNKQRTKHKTNIKDIINKKLHIVQNLDPFFRTIATKKQHKWYAKWWKVWTKKQFIFSYKVKKKYIPFSQPYSTCGPATFYVQPETHNH